MKTPFFLLLFVVSCAHANTYYVSSSGNDNNRGTSPTSPLKTIAKVNAIFGDLRPGDKVLFKCGETFYGQLVVNQSGNSDNPITIGSYGTGAKPIITGFVPATGWTQVGRNIWESAPLGATDAVNMVTINGVQYAVGRYPNADAPNKGYLPITSHDGMTSITGNALPGTPDWTGGTVVIRVNHWMFQYATITAQSGNTLTYNASSGKEKEAADGFGFFIENHPATLDEFGEWYYNPSTKKLRVYVDNKTPERYTINVSTVNKLITVSKQANILFDGICVQGANEDGFMLDGAPGITIRNCDILFCAGNGINTKQGSTQNFTAENNFISDCGNFGMNLQLAGQGQIIRNNTVRRIGLLPGVGGTGGQSRSGIISNSGSNKLIEGNRVDSVGYAGIRFGGNDATVQHNVVSNFTLTLDDGGGIYTTNQGGKEKGNRKILNNLVYNGIGAPEGTPKANAKQSPGIYLDDNSSGVEVAGNTVWNCNQAGLFVHNAHNLNIHNNTFYNNGTQVLFVYGGDKYPPITDVTFENNVCFSRTAAQPVANFSTKGDDIASFGTIDHNIYLSPPGEAQTIVAVTGIYQRGAQQKQKHSPDTWKTAYGHDANSQYLQKGSAEGVRLEYNETALPRTVRLDRTYTDASDATYNGTVTLQPYSALLLFPANGTGASNAIAAPGMDRGKPGAKKH